jgi:ketosteroid isomerase-like protein
MAIRAVTGADTLAVVERFNQAWNRHDIGAVSALLADDVVFENTNPPPDGARVTGKADVARIFEQWFARNPDGYFDAEEMFVVEDRCVVRWIYRKTRDGQPWHLRGVDIFRVRNRRVVEKLSYVKG